MDRDITTRWRPARFLVYWPVIILPVILGGARPWLWGFVAGVFGIILALNSFSSRRIVSRSDVKGPTLVLLPILFYPFLQIVPMPMPLIAFLSPQRAAWLQRAYEATGRASFCAALSYVPIDTVFSAFWLLTLACFALVLHNLMRKGALESGKFFQVLFTMAALEAFLGLLQALVPTLRLGYQPLGDATGTFANRNHYAAFLGMVWPLLAAWLLTLTPEKQLRSHQLYDEKSHQQATREKQIFLMLVTGLVLLGLIFSKSRGGILSALIGTTVLVLFGGKRSRFLIPVIAACWIIVLAYGFVIGFDDIAARFMMMQKDAPRRYKIWHMTWKMISDNWLIGTGLGTYDPASFLYQVYDTDLMKIGDAHNDYMEVLAEWGVPMGMSIILLVWGYWWSTAIGLLRQDRITPDNAKKTGKNISYKNTYTNEVQVQEDAKKGKLIRAGALAGSAAFLTHIWVEFNWQIPANQLYFVILLVLMRYRVPHPQGGEQPDIIPHPMESAH